MKRMAYRERRLWRWMPLILSACMALPCFVPGKFARASGEQASRYQLEKVVMLMRHGVRSGFFPERHAQYSGKPWPDFGYQNGQLTAHGRDALVLWGRYHRTLLNQAGLFVADQALATADVHVETSPKQRTRESADAFLRGLSPGFVRQPDRADAGQLFIPHECGLTFPDKASAQAAAMAGLGMSLPAAQAHYRPAILAVERALSIPEGRVADQPWRVSTTDYVRFEPLGGLEDMLETVRMQYGNGMPLERVAFGNARDAKAVAELMRIRTLFWQTVHLPRYLALQSYAPLFATLSHALLDDMPVRTTRSDNGNADGLPTGAKVALYVGHDTNIAPISAILGFNWQMPDGLPNDQQPGGLIMFERLRDRETGERFVRVSYHAQTLDQIRFLSPLGHACAMAAAPARLSAGTPPTGAPRGMPFRADFAPPAEWGARADHLIPIAEYKAMVRAVAVEAQPGARLAVPREVADAEKPLL